MFTSAAVLQLIFQSRHTLKFLKLSNGKHGKSNAWKYTGYACIVRFVQHREPLEAETKAIAKSKSKYVRRHRHTDYRYDRGQRIPYGVMFQGCQ